MTESLEAPFTGWRIAYFIAQISLLPSILAIVIHWKVCIHSSSLLSHSSFRMMVVGKEEEDEEKGVGLDTKNGSRRYHFFSHF